jgi:putative SOS response-associated peptidase YedK
LVCTYSVPPKIPASEHSQSPQWGCFPVPVFFRQPRRDAAGACADWAKDIKVGFANINAKAEEIESKPAFREAFQRPRSLVPVDVFYEDRC